MLTENTVNKLYEMRLTAMAKAFKDQITDINISKMSFEAAPVKFYRLRFCQLLQGFFAKTT